MFDGDDVDDGDGPDFPLAVRAAGVMWLCLGGLQLIGAAAYTAVTLARDGELNRSFVGVLYLAALSVYPCVEACRVLLGRAKDTENGSALSLMYGGAGVLVAGSAAWIDALVPDMLRQQLLAGTPGSVLALAVLGLAPAHVVAGALGLGGRRQYRVWREHHHPKKVRP